MEYIRFGRTSLLWFVTTSRRTPSWAALPSLPIHALYFFEPLCYTYPILAWQFV